MKKAGAPVAAISAAYSLALASVSDLHGAVPSSHEEQGLASPAGKCTGSASVRGGGADKFAPRFDGLRFIETLVTAHR